MVSKLFNILYISSSFTNITIPFISINFAVFWNAWFSKIFWKIHWGNVFLSFHMSFLKIKTQHFTLLFLFRCFEWPTYFFALKKRNCCYLCRFYQFSYYKQCCHKLSEYFDKWNKMCLPLSITFSTLSDINTTFKIGITIT